FELGKRALHNADFEQAVKHLYKAISDDPDSIEEDALARSMLSQSLQELSRYEEAYSVVQKYEEPQILGVLPLVIRPRVKLAIGWSNSWLGNYPKAIASLNEAMKVFLELQDTHGTSEAHYALGRTYIRINEFKIARDHLLTAANLRETSDNREML